MSEQTPAKVMEVRGKFYELLSHCIPPTVILKVRSSLRTPGSALKSRIISLVCRLLLIGLLTKWMNH